jgi:Fic family protein
MILEPVPPFDPKLFDFSRLSAHLDIPEIVRQANEEYVYWDQFKHHPMPDGIQTEEAWHYVRFIRFANQKIAPFFDKNLKPFVYWIPDSLSSGLSLIDRNSGGISTTAQIGAFSSSPFVISSLMEEAIASSQLEGAATTRKVAKEMLRSGRKPVDKSEQMILNNWVTMQYLREREVRPLTPKEILHIHALITDQTMDNPLTSGRLRQNDDIVVEYNHKTVHTPPTFSTLPQRLDALCKFANEDGQHPWIHPVVKAAMLHFQLAYDHPFEDGNGRTARALFYWYLLSRKYFLFQYLPISRYFIRAPGQYMRAFLYTETDGNDLTYFLNYNLKAIQKGLTEARLYLKNKQSELASSTSLLKNQRNLNIRQKSLVHHALLHPDATYTLQIHRIYHDIAYATARADLIGLDRKGFLKRIKQGKAFVFVPATDLAKRLKITEI